MESRKIIYHVAVSGLHCRSSRELVGLAMRALEGVEAASIDADDTLSVFADGDIVIPDDIIRALVDVGVAPRGEITVSTPAVTLARSPELAVSQAQLTPPLACETEVAVQLDRPAAVAEERSWRGGVAVALAPAAGYPRQRVDPSRHGVSSCCCVPARIAGATDQGRRVRQLHPNRIDVIPAYLWRSSSARVTLPARVLFEQFDIDQTSLMAGGRATGLAPGNYQFSCGIHGLGLSWPRHSTPDPRGRDDFEIETRNRSCGNVAGLDQPTASGCSQRRREGA
jgi:hypothetical protein